MQVFVSGVSVFGPGLSGWSASRAILAGEADYVPSDLVLQPPALLSATERRRTGAVVRLALAVAQEASAMADVAPGALRSVFGSSNGDAVIVNTILAALTEGDGLISPTQFHNSVHNAAAGYWSIATASAQPATCLGCHDSTFAAALLKAAAEVVVEDEPVLLCVYDVPIPAPLGAHRITTCPFGIGLVLEPRPSSRSIARLDVRHTCEGAVEAAAGPHLPALRPLAAGNPAAQGVRLLEALARGGADTFSLGYLDGRLDVTVRPCSTATAYAR